MLQFFDILLFFSGVCAQKKSFFFTNLLNKKITSYKIFLNFLFLTAFIISLNSLETAKNISIFFEAKENR